MWVCLNDPEQKDPESGLGAPLGPSRHSLVPSELAPALYPLSADFSPWLRQDYLLLKSLDSTEFNSQISSLYGHTHYGSKRTLVFTDPGQLGPAMAGLFAFSFTEQRAVEDFQVQF